MMEKISPVMQRRIRAFRANRRGWWSLWIFIGLFVLTLFSNFVANDRPLVMSINHHLYFPVLVRHTEREYGGQLPFEPDFRSPYMKELVARGHGWMVFPPIPFNYDTVNFDLEVPAPSAPSRENWLGTDDQGRDVLSRAIHGLQISILFGLLLTVVSVLIATVFGAIQGYFGGLVDLFGQRLQDVWSGLPMLYILIILGSFVTPNFWWLMLVMSLFLWLNLVDLVRAEFLRGRALEYVKAARALGLSDLKIMFRHILPNALTATLTYVPFMVGTAISTLAALDFLGFGLPAGSPSLGELTLQSTQNMQAPWLAATAVGSIGLVMALLVFIGDALRDAFDPRVA